MSGPGRRALDGADLAPPRRLEATPVRGAYRRAVLLFLRLILQAWQFIGLTLFGPACRFEPSCSRYADEALQAHGPLRGLFYSLRRFASCHPLHAGGFDPVPEARDIRIASPVSRARIEV